MTYVINSKTQLNKCMDGMVKQIDDFSLIFEGLQQSKQMGMIYLLTDQLSEQAFQ